MAQAYFSLVTHAGRIKLAASAAGGDPVTITHFAVGDGNGADTNPTTNSTALVREVWRTQVESVATDPDNPSAILVTAIIPTNAGGWWMREFGIFDKSGTMIAVARPVSQYKPTALEGQLEDIRYEFQIIIGEAANVTLLVDPSLIFATRDWVQTRRIPMAQMNRLPWLPVMSMTITVPPAAPAQGDAYLVPSNASGVWSGKGGMIAEWIGTAWAYSTPADGHGVSLPDARLFIRVAGQYVELLASDIRAGLVELATIAEAKAGKDTGRAVTPAGLAAAIADAITTLVNGSPAAMDTLRELADALGNDANFAASMTNALAGKVDLTRTATDTRTGIVELATPAEAKAGTDKERAVTPEGLAATIADVMPPRPNLCPNGGFELGLAGIEVVKLGLSSWGAGLVENQWGRSVALSAPTDGTYVITWPQFRVGAGLTYTISGDAVLLASSGTVRYSLGWYDASGSLISYSGSKARGAGDFDDSAAGRQSMAYAVVAPTGAVSARLRCVFESVVAPTALYARLAKVEKGALPATAYTPPPPAPKHVMQSYNVAGTYSWVCPIGVTRVKAIVTGAGGGGARSTASQSGASGGAGGTAIGFVTVTPGTSYTIIVGAGGAGGNWSTIADGSAGGSSSAFGLTGVGGGGSVDTFNNGFGGAASGGDINIRGGDGQDALSGSNWYSANGGASYWGGGASSSTADSSASVVPGSGGCSSYGGVARAGGAGAAGIVVLEY